MYKISLKKKAAKELVKLPALIAIAIANSIDHLSEEPRQHGSQKLKGSKEDLWRVRVGDYRII